MISFNVVSLACISPGIHTREQWQDVFNGQSPTNDTLDASLLKKIPPMLRRRLGRLGRCAAAAFLSLPTQNPTYPIIYASRHGDTQLSSSLLKGIANEEPMSPTQFSLAVHNAIGGVISIAQKNTAPMTAIAAMEAMPLQALFEAAGQLTDTDKVVCVLYDSPLPEHYESYATSVERPIALAVELEMNSGNPLGEGVLSIQPAVDASADSHELSLNNFARLMIEGGAITAHANQQTWTVSYEALHNG
jgi:hypothetical protein